MRLAWRVLFFGLCVNLAVTVITTTLGVSPGLTEEIKDMQDPGDIVDTWNWGGTGSLVGDISSGLRFFWNINAPFIEDFPKLLASMGCPPVVLDPLKLMWRFIWITFVVEFISGRHIMYD